MTISQTDWKYVSVDPDPGFSEEHNKRVIAEVIRKNEVLFARKERERKQKVKERSGAIASYVKNVKDNTSLEGYFGKKYLTELRGQQIIDKLKNAERQAKVNKAFE